MDKFAAMSAFAAVAKSNSFAEAARQTGLSRSQINKLVIALEDELGVTLFNRTTRKVTLTATGAAYRERVNQIMADLHETEMLLQNNQSTPVGELKINAPMSFGTLHLGKAIVEFMQHYPNIRVQLMLSDEKIDPVSNGFDLTIRIATPSDSPSLIEHDIVKIQRVICASPSLIEKDFLPEHPEQLRHLPCLHYGNLPSGNNWKLTGPDGEHIVRVNGLMCSNNAEVLADGCIAGLGYALLPTFIASRPLQQKKLVQVLPEYQAPPVFLSLLYTPNRHLSARIALFVKFMHDRFSHANFENIQQIKQ